MANRFTTEQQAAIEAEGRTIVSASAGSGKTTVMIEKIIRLIKSGCRVDELLAVTFTKKAAAQMKEKLCKELIEEINSQSVSSEKRAELKKQLSDVPNADISTIHSFCAKLIRSHFFAAGVDNGFRVIGGDDAEGVALKNEALDELLEEGYEQQEESFMSLLAVYWRKKSDNALRKIFTTVYENLRARADYREYLERSGAYTEQTFDAICDDLLRILQEKCRYYQTLAQEELRFFEETGGAGQIAVCNELIEGLSAVLAATDYFTACACVKPKFTVSRKGKSDGEEKRNHIERLTFIKGKVVKIYEDELGATLSRDEELKNFLRSGEIAAALAKYLLRFDDKYAALKAERSVLDYNDLEHKALALLKNADVAAEMRKKYRYVFVDEYQDVNPVQEEIISLLSSDNLFLVGDVKQSIYGFRGSKSKFFVEKQREFASNGGNNLAMTRNFRSADVVLDAVNEQFSLAMTLQTSNVDYGVDSYMEKGGRYALNSGKVSVHFLGKEEKTPPQKRGVYSVREKALRKDHSESRAAKLIRSIIEAERNSQIFDPDIGGYRKVEYSDIAVLSRKKQGQIAATVASLAAEGVPVTAAAAVNVCDYAEVKTLIDILSLIDNAEQDVPLCSALLSSMGDLTADDLTAIRLAYAGENFFRNACRRYAEEQSDFTAHKLRKFYDYYANVRARSQTLGAGELLTEILSETRMEGRLLSMENGVACLRRIHRFIEESVATEPLCVHEFLERLRDLDYKIEFSENGGEESVKVLTMHSSKGLEYPVVILDNLSAPFRGTDHDDVFVEEKYGLAPRAYDTEKMTKRSTLLRRLHEERETDSATQDELNLYYVALTRAKHTLHMLFEGRSPMSNVKYARSFAEFTDFSVWEKYVVKDEVFDLPKQERTALVFRPDETLTRGIMQAFLWEYPSTGYENLPVKSSATALLSDLDFVVNEDGGEGAREETRAIVDAESGAICAADTAERKDREKSIATGLAYHAFLENFDFSLLYDEQGVAVPREILQESVAACYAQFTKENADSAALMTVEKLVEILSNQVFYRLSGARLHKEQQFLVSLPVKDTYAKQAGVEGLSMRDDREEMIFQGAIDLLAIDEDGARIIDYKYSRKGADYLREHYAPQLNLYRLAVEKIMRIPKEKIRCTIVNIYHGFQVDLD